MFEETPAERFDRLAAQADAGLWDESTLSKREGTEADQLREAARAARWDDLAPDEQAYHPDIFRRLG